MNEKKLILGCLQHDRSCQKELYDNYSRQMYSICLRYHKDVDMANEALQRSFIKVYENLGSFKAGSLGGWIRTIVVRTAIDLIKERQKLRFSDVDQLEQIPSDWDSNDNSFDHINYDALLQLLDEMPLGYRSVFSMYVLDEIKHDQIAEILDITAATSRSQLFKAKNMLRKLVVEKFGITTMQKR